MYLGVYCTVAHGRWNRGGTEGMRPPQKISRERQGERFLVEKNKTRLASISIVQCRPIYKTS